MDPEYIEIFATLPDNIFAAGLALIIIKALMDCLK